MIAEAPLIERIALATAQAKWPALVRRCPRPTVRYGLLGPTWAGWAEPSTCVVRVQKFLLPSWKCGVLVHEFGHLAGQSHSTKGIMRPVFNRGAIPAGCLKLAPRE